MFYGRIKDTFTPVIRGKLSEFDTEVIDHVTWNDDDTKVTASILDMIQKGADVVVCTGGMSVDPDDKTPLAIRNTGADIVSYGAPVLPGAMFLLAYYQVKDGEIPVRLPSWDFRAASCMPGVLYLTWFCPESWRMTR